MEHIPKTSDHEIYLDVTAVVLESRNQVDGMSRRLGELFCRVYCQKFIRGHCNLDGAGGKHKSMTWRK